MKIQCRFLGRIGNDLVLEEPKEGFQVLRLSLAVSEARRDPVTQAWNEQTEWYEVTAMGKQAAIIAQYSQKGQQLFVECVLRNDRWVDKSTDQKRKKLTLVLTNFEFCSKGKADEFVNNPQDKPKVKNKDQDQEDIFLDDEPVPFI